jgi:hypothetical protein
VPVHVWALLRRLRDRSDWASLMVADGGLVVRDLLAADPGTVFKRVRDRNADANPCWDGGREVPISVESANASGETRWPQGPWPGEVW